jgi:ABC-type sugar transport system substrate-binding protein
MKDRTIGLFLLTRENDYQRLQETEAVATAHRLHVPLEVFFCESDAQVQAQQIYAFVHAHEAGSIVVVEPLSEGPLDAVSRHAVLEGMGWILLHSAASYMEELRISFPRLLLVSVTADQKDIGRLQGKQFETLLRGKGTMLYVEGPARSAAAAGRFAGMREIIDHTQVKYQVVHGDWTEEGGEQVVSSWLRTSNVAAQLQLIGCQNDAMAAGALRALAGAVAHFGRIDVTRVPVTGVDGNPEHGMALVDRGRLAATVIMPPVSGRAIELIHEAWNTIGFAPPPVVRLSVRSYPEMSTIALRAARGH